MSSDDSKKATNLAGVVKWLVVGVVAITALVLFKVEIGQVIIQADEIVIPNVITIKKADTLLGEVEVSKVSVKPNKSTQDGINGNVFTSNKHQFQISWPDNGDWSASDTSGNALMQQMGMPPTMDLPIMILRNQFVDNFRPNVNVVVENSGTMSVTDYVNLNLGLLEQQGWQILTKEIDEATQGAFISFYNTMMGNKIYQFQKIVMANGKGYVITASQLPLDDAGSEQLRQDLLGIMNSFRIIEG